MTLPTTQLDNHVDLSPDLIDEYEEYLEEIDLAESSIDTYLSVLRHMDRTLPAGLVSAHTEELRDWINGKNHKRSTRQLYRTIVCGFFDWATDPQSRRVDFNSAHLLAKVRTVPGVPKPIDTEQLHDILARAVEPHRTRYVIAAYTGARCIELSRLDRDHITPEDVSLHGKGDKPRRVPTHPIVWELAGHLADGPICVDARGNRLHRQEISRTGNRYLQNTLGLSGVTMHRLRHWFGTQAYEASGRDIRAVQELLGHANVSTTQGYIEASRARMAAAVSGLPVAA